MDCKHWNHDWIASLYDELAPEEEGRMRTHLAECTGCRRHLDELAGCRRILQEATPVVPASPRVVVLQPGSSWRPLWSFAAGVACAAVLFAGGWFAVGGRSPIPGPVPGEAVEIAERFSLASPAAAQLLALEQRIAQLESTGPETGSDVDAVLSRVQFRHEMDRLVENIDRRRSEDLSYVLQSITATQVSTGAWMDETEQALQLLALRQNPEVRDW